MKKLIRITTVPISLEKLLEDQLAHMSAFYEVIAISSEKERLKKYGDREGVKIFALDLTRKITPLKDLRAVYRLYRFLKKEKPLIVHTHTPKAGIVGMLASWLAAVPLRLHTVAGLPLLETSGFKRTILNAVEKLTYIFATNIYPNSNGLKEIIISNGLAPETKLKVLGQGSSNGIDTTYFSAEQLKPTVLSKLRDDLGIPQENFVYVFVGRIVADKGINELVNAFVKLNLKCPTTTLLLVGPLENELDPLNENTRSQISSHSHIISVGYQADVRAYFALSDALVFPSYREGFPNVVMQAGAMELPAIVSNINGCNEIIHHKKNGLIVPVKDEDELECAMIELLTNKFLYSTLKSNARSEITAHYERATIWKLLREEYEQLEKNL